MNRRINNKITSFNLFNTSKPKFILLFLHGYGASKEDFSSLIPFFSNLKDTMIVIPNAPFNCDMGIGYQWFPVELNDHSIKMDLSQCKEAFNLLIYFINNLSQEYNVPLCNFGIFGFSQGGVMALMSALYFPHKIGGVVSHSGLLYNWNNSLDKLDLPLNEGANILLIHGKNDTVVPFDFAEKTYEFLNSNHAKLITFFKDDLGHHIDEDTLTETKNFLRYSLLIS